MPNVESDTPLQLNRDFSSIVDPRTGRELSGRRMLRAAETLAQRGFQRLLVEAGREVLAEQDREEAN